MCSQSEKKEEKRTARINNTSFTRNELINHKWQNQTLSRTPIKKKEKKKRTLSRTRNWVWVWVIDISILQRSHPPNQYRHSPTKTNNNSVSHVLRSFSFFFFYTSSLPFLAPKHLLPRNSTPPFFVCCSSVVLAFGLGESREIMPNWELKNCCQHDQVVFLATIGVFTVVILAVRFVLLSYFLIFFFFFPWLSVCLILEKGKQKKWNWVCYV